MPNPIDVHVGKRLRLRRSMLGLSQERLGKEVGVTFQQVQKYERGSNRVGASRLFQFSKILKVSPNYFFEDAGGAEMLASGMAEEGSGYEADILGSRETQQLLRAYYSIKDAKTRKRVLDLVRTLAEQNA